MPYLVFCSWSLRSPFVACRALMILNLALALGEGHEQEVLLRRVPDDDLARLLG